MKNCIMLWKNDAVDLAINNQRRAFSDAYNNEVLAESKIYIELSSKNPLSKLSSLETEDLKNTPAFLSSTRPDSRIPLVRNQVPVKKTYCAFWEKDNSEYYIEEFADILKSCF
jgi:hypothetical protein